jgi:ActR/RegA family two-component response regulator
MMEDDKKILIVDDEDSFRNHLMRLFMRRGYAVTDVATGNEALALADQKPYWWNGRANSRRCDTRVIYCDTN